MDIKVVHHKPDERIKPDLGHDKYIDWMQDDTERDPTPANKRRSEMVKETKPKAGTGPSIEGKQLGLKPGPNKL